VLVDFSCDICFDLIVLIDLYFLVSMLIYFFSFFFFNDTATTEIYTLSLHDALPISASVDGCEDCLRTGSKWLHLRICLTCGHVRSEEHTSELQSRSDLVCRLLLEKKKKKKKKP